jgi:hypothetical protein
VIVESPPDEEGIVLSVLRQRDRPPADLALLAGIDACAEHLGDQLRPEADAQDGPSGRDRLFDEGDLGAQEGVLVLLVGAHRAAEHDQTADPAEILRDGLAARQIQRAMMDTTLTQRIADEPHALRCRMAKYQPRRALPGSVLLVPPSHPRPVSLTAG